MNFSTIMLVMYLRQIGLRNLCETEVCGVMLIVNYFKISAYFNTTECRTHCVDMRKWPFNPLFIMVQQLQEEQEALIRGLMNVSFYKLKIIVRFVHIY